MSDSTLQPVLPGISEATEQALKQLNPDFKLCPVCRCCEMVTHYVDCTNCEDGYSGHDCGEDCCCCLDPEPNVVCDICEGKGGWTVEYCIGGCVDGKVHARTDWNFLEE